MTSLRTVTGDLSHVDGTPWSGALVVFEMRSGPYTVVPALTYPQEKQGMTTDEDGAFTIDLTAGLGIWWICHLPDGDAFQFALNEGATITIEQLRAEASGAPVPISYPTSDIVITAPHQGQILRHNGLQFVNVNWPGVDVMADFGAVGDGVTDDTAAIQAAINTVQTAGGGTIFLPHGNYLVSETLIITESPVSIMGVGTGHAALYSGAPLADEDYGSLVTWGGGADPVFATSQMRGAFWQSFAIDGSTTATVGIAHDRVRGCSFSHLRVSRCATVGLRLYVDASAVGPDNCMWNTFLNTYLDSSPKALELLGNDPDGNCCHNSFHGLYAVCGEYGIDLDEADNNVFTNLWTTTIAPATINTHTVRFGGWAYSNMMLGCQGRAYAVTSNLVFADNVGGNVIFGYDRANGQPAPTLEAGSRLDWTESGFNSSGWSLRRLNLTTEEAEGIVLDATSSGGAHYIDARLIGNRLSPLDRGLLLGIASGTDGYVSLYSHLTEMLRVDAGGVGIWDVTTIKPATGASTLTLDTTEAAQESSIYFLSEGVNKWILYRGAGNDFTINNAMTADTALTINATTNVVSVESDRFRVASQHTPASSSAAGVQGSICWDNSYVYVATDTNTWRRAAIATW